MAGRGRIELSGSGPEVDFARELRGVRDRRGITLRVLAEKSGYSQASLSAAERGRRLPCWELVDAFVQGCGDDPAPWRPKWELAKSAATPQAKTPVDAAPPPPLPAPLSPPPPSPVSSRSNPRRHKRLIYASTAVVLALGGLLWATLSAAAGSAAPLPARADDTFGCVGADAPSTVALNPSDPRAAGWRSSRPIPWGAPQCQNQVWWAPYLNGGANPAAYFSWTFGASNKASVCALWAYIPPPPAGHLGGVAHYAIQDGVDTSAPHLAYLDVAQADHKGTWYPLGNYPIESGYIKVTLDNSSSDPNPQHGPMAGPLHAACHRHGEYG